ncbi:MAG: acylphosphatase [Nocardioidaceae bacterium]
MRNRSDGAVEALFEGEPEAVAQLCRWCESGPSHAGVERVDETDEEPSGRHGFDVRD